MLAAQACQTYGIKPCVSMDHWNKGKFDLEFEEASVNSSIQRTSMMVSAVATLQCC